MEKNKNEASLSTCLKRIVESTEQEEIVAWITLLECYLSKNRSGMTINNECERYFVLLFKKLGELELPQKNDIILNIYFPLYKSCPHSIFLNRCITPEIAFSIITNLNSINSKINNFNIFHSICNIDEIKEKDVIKLYNSLYLGYLIQKIDITTEIITMFNVFISYFIKSVGNKKKTFASPLLIIDSFFETFLIIEIELIDKSNTNGFKVTEIIQMLKTCFTDLNDKIFKFKFYNKTLMIKILIFLCYFTSFLQYLNNEDIMTPLVEIIINLIEESENYLMMLLYQVLDALFSQNAKKNLEQQLSKNLYIPYLQNIVNSDALQDIVNNSKLSEYDKIFQQMLQITNNCNVYKGALYIVGIIMERASTFKTRNRFKIFYYPHVYLSFFEKYINQEGKGHKNYDNEILFCISKLIILEGDRFTQKDWDKILSFCSIISEKINNNKLVNQQLTPQIGTIVNKIYFLSTRHSIVLSENHKTTITHLIGFLIRKAQTINYKFIIDLISNSSEELVNFLLEYYFQKCFYTTMKIDDINKERYMILFDIFRTISELVDKGSNKMKAIIEGKMIKNYDMLIQSIIEGSKNNSVDNIDELFKFLSKIMIQVIDFSQNDANFKLFVENILSYKEDNWIEADNNTNLVEYLQNTFRKMLIKFNDILKAQKMKIIIDTAFLEENPRFQKNSFLINVLLENLDLTDNNQIIFWKTMDEKKSQLFPCLFYKKNEKNSKDEKYYTFLDFEKIYQKIIRQFSQKIKGLLDPSQRNIGFITKNFKMICNVLILGMEKPHLFSKQNLLDLLTSIVNDAIFELFSNKDYYLISKTILKIISRANYLLNYQNSDSFFGEISTQNNDVFYHFEPHETVKEKMYELFKKNLAKIKNVVLKSNQKIRIEKPGNLFVSKDKSLEKKREAEIKELMDQYHITFKLMMFLLYSTNENKKLVKRNLVLENDINIIISFLYTIVFTFENIVFDDYLFIVGALFHLKNQVYFCEPGIVIKCIHLCLTFAYPKYANEILQNFSPFIKDISNDKVANIIIPEEYEPFFSHFCDILTLSYLSFIDGIYEINNGNIQRVQRGSIFICYDVLKNIFTKIKKNDRTALFQLFAYKILMAKNPERDNLTNLDKSFFKKHIDKIKILRAKKEVIGIREISNNKCEVIILSSISNIKFTVELNSNQNNSCSKEEKLKQVNSLFGLLNQEEQKIDKINKEESKILSSNQIMEKKNAFPLTFFYFDEMIKTYKKKNDDVEEICNEQIKKKISQLIDIPVNFTFSVNIWFCNSNTDDYSNNIFSRTNQDELPLCFINFLSSLGNVNYNDKNEKTLMYKDEFYTIEFKMCNYLQTSKDKIQMLKQNKINLIWINNSRTDIEIINNVFTANANSPFYLFFISPVSDSHCFIRKRASSKKEKVESLFIHDYIINNNSLSSIRYFMNNIIILCEWFQLYQENNLPSQPKEKVGVSIMTNFTNLFDRPNSTPVISVKDNLIKRYNLINQICGFGK